MHTGWVGVRSCYRLGARRRLRGGPTWHHDGHDSWVEKVSYWDGGSLVDIDVDSFRDEINVAMGWDKCVIK